MRKKNILITGASSGLGAAFAHYCASQGHHLALVARRLDQLEHLAEQLREQYQVQIEVAQLDINDHERILPIFMGLSDLLANIDCVVLNAGIVKVRRLADEHFNRDIEVFHTNTIATIACADAAQKMFHIQGYGGQLLVISSYSAFFGLPHAAAYSASKAAVASYFNTIRRALKKQNIQLSIIYPGFVQTDLLKDFRSILPIVAQPEDIAKQLYHVMQTNKAEAIVPPLPWKVLYGVQQFTPKPLLRWLSQLL